MTKKQQLILKLALIGLGLAAIRIVRADQPNCKALCQDPTSQVTTSKGCKTLQQCIVQYEEPEYKDTPDALKSCGLCFPGAPKLITGKLSKQETDLYSSKLKKISLKVYQDPSAVSTGLPTTRITVFLANQKEYLLLFGKVPTTANIDALYKKGGLLFNSKKPNDTSYKIRRASMGIATEPVNLIATPNLGDKTAAISLQVTVTMPYTGSLSTKKGGSLEPQAVAAWWLSKGGSCTIQVPTIAGQGSLKRINCALAA